MRHRIQIQQRSSAQDASGDQVIAWTTVATRSASIAPLTGTEIFASQARNAKVTTKFVTRYVSQLAPERRIVWDGRVFDVVSAERVNGVKHEMVTIADELVGVAP